MFGKIDCYRCATDCATRSDIKNRLKVNGVIYLLHVGKCFVLYYI